MIKYQAISQANKTAQRLKRDTYNRSWGDKDHTRDGDMLTLFTVEPEALCDSEHNLKLVLSVASAYNQRLVVIKTNMIQVAGSTNQHQQVGNLLFPDQWRKEHQKWLDSNNPVAPRWDQSDLGQMCEFYTWRPALIMPKHQGVYDVHSGQRITNRREIIQRMWDLGFAAHRGRPLSIAKIRWTGSRQELELATQLAEQHWDRRNTSEVAKKLVSVFRSINRYAAWPGAW
jgi:hypothetical protein